MKYPLLNIVLKAHESTNIYTKGALFLSFVCFAFLIVIRICLPIVFALFIDSVIKSTENWQNYGLLYIFMFFFRRVLSECQWSSYLVYDQQIRRYVMLRILGSFFHIRFSELSKKAHSEFVVIIDRGVYGLQSAAALFLFEIFPPIIEACVVVLVVSLSVNIFSGFSCLLIVIFFVFFTYRITNRVRKFEENSYSTSTKNYKIISESLRSYELIRSFRLKNWAQDRYSSANKKFINDTLKTIKPSLMLAFVQGILIMTLMALVILIVHLGDGVSSVKVSQLVLINGLLLQVSQPLIEFAYSLKTFISGLSSSRELNDVLKLQKSDEKISLDFQENKDFIFRFENLSVNYGKKTVLRCEKKDIPQTNLLGLYGSSGSGKTTLAKVMSGLLEFSGCVKCTYPMHEIYYCSQSVEIFDLSLRDNICFGQECSDKSLEDILKLSGFTDAERKELGEYPLGENGSRISGGQKKRIGIARMLYHNAKIMIFDEPTAELDKVSCELVIESIVNVSKKGGVVIVVSHHKDLIDRCDALITVQDGLIL